jgi:hypothetical protein
MVREEHGKIGFSVGRLRVVVRLELIHHNGCEAIAGLL